MDPDFAREYYESASAKHWWFQGRRQLVKDLLGSRGITAGLFLDLGAGPETLFPESLTVVKLDVVRPDGVSGIFVQGSAELLPFRQSSVDGVGLFEVLEHLDDPDRCLAEISRVVRPDGLVLVTVPAHQSLWSPHDDLVGHKRRYTTESLQNQLVACGLRIEWVSAFYGFLVGPAIIRRILSLQWAMKVPRSSVNRILAQVATRSARSAMRRPNRRGLSIAAVATVR